MKNKTTHGIKELIKSLINNLIWTGQNKGRPVYARYGVPLLFVILVTVFKLQLNDLIGVKSPFLLYLGIVCFSAIYGGTGPAILISITSILTADYFFVAPVGAFSFNTDTCIKITLFLTECLSLTLLSYAVKVAYQQVNKNEQLFKAMIEKGSEGIILTDRSGVRVYCSPSIEKVIGYTAEEFLELEAWVLADPEELPWMMEQLDGLMKHPGKNISFIHRMKHKNGNWLWIENSITNLLDDPAVNAIVANFYNVTERVTLEQQKEDFIGIASHELKTPLTSLKASLQLLNRMKDDPGSPNFPKMIEQANRSMDRITSLVEGLLNASRVNQGQLHITKSVFNLSEMIEKCCSHIRLEDKYHLILQGDRRLQVCADENRIDQVIVNLVNNAMKYASESDEIYLIIDKSGKMAKVSVKDSGPGISPDKIPHLFDRYYRADPEGIQYSGLGLGLYISAEIIRKHDGEIGVDSQLGKGSTFWFTLPIEG